MSNTEADRRDYFTEVAFDLTRAAVLSQLTPDNSRSSALAHDLWTTAVKGAELAVHVGASPVESAGFLIGLTESVGMQCDRRGVENGVSQRFSAYGSGVKAALGLFATDRAEKS